LINFHKRALISQVIREIQQYQQAPYCLEAVPLLQEWLINSEFLSEDECYRESLKIETKQNRQRAPSDSPTPGTPSAFSVEA
jgi:son of sevenless-like protein